MSNVINLAAVAAMATEEGAWVNDPFQCVVKNAKMGQPASQGGRAKPSKCCLVDPENPNSVLWAAWFGGNFNKYEDKVIRVSGKGTKIGLYQGKPEINIGKEATVEIVGDAPAALTAPPPAARHPAPAGKPGEDPAVRFHREMKKTALLWTHCYQYAVNVITKIPEELPDEMFQSLVSSLFITAKERGLLDKIPALRSVDDKGNPIPFVAPTPDPAAAVAEAERVKRETEEKARLAAEAEKRRLAEQQENIDEDVPF